MSAAVCLMLWETCKRIDINIWKLPQEMKKKKKPDCVIGGDDLPKVCKKIGG